MSRKNYRSKRISSKKSRSLRKKVRSRSLRKKVRSRSLRNRRNLRRRRMRGGRFPASQSPPTEILEDNDTENRRGHTPKKEPPKGFIYLANMSKNTIDYIGGLLVWVETDCYPLLQESAREIGCPTRTTTSQSSSQESKKVWRKGALETYELEATASMGIGQAGTNPNIGRIKRIRVSYDDLIPPQIRALAAEGYTVGRGGEALFKEVDLNISMILVPATDLTLEIIDDIHRNYYLFTNGESVPEGANVSWPN
jgi:hypothetical protein